jgi:hypothetical protein
MRILHPCDAEISFFTGGFHLYSAIHVQSTPGERLMNSNHVFGNLADFRAPTPEAIDAAMRRARLERSRAVYDLLHLAGARIAGWLRSGRVGAAPQGCGHSA